MSFAEAVESSSLHDGKCSCYHIKLVQELPFYVFGMCLNCWYGEECCFLLLQVNLLGTLFLAMYFTEFLFFQQENAILTMELRNYFSLYCLHQETQLIHIYLPLTSHILGAFVNSQIQGHKEVSFSGLHSFSQNMSKNLNVFVFTCGPSFFNHLSCWLLS